MLACCMACGCVACRYRCQPVARRAPAPPRAHAPDACLARGPAHDAACLQLLSAPVRRTVWPCPRCGPTLSLLSLSLCMHARNAMRLCPSPLWLRVHACVGPRAFAARQPYVRATCLAWALGAHPDGAAARQRGNPSSSISPTGSLWLCGTSLWLVSILAPALLRTALAPLFWRGHFPTCCKLQDHLRL